MFEYLFGTTFTVSLAELIGMFAFGSFVALACVAIILGTKWMRATREVAPAPLAVVEPMKVVPPWDEPVDDGPGVTPGPGWRRGLELESTPMFGALPDHESVWRMPSWNLDDPQRTQMMRIIDGVDADDLDVDLGEPQPLPGFEVSAADRRRLSLPEELIAEVTAALPSRKAKAEVSA